MKKSNGYTNGIKILEVVIFVYFLTVYLTALFTLSKQTFHSVINVFTDVHLDTFITHSVV